MLLGDLVPPGSMLYACLFFDFLEKSKNKQVSVLLGGLMPPGSMLYVWLF